MLITISYYVAGDCVEEEQGIAIVQNLYSFQNVKMKPQYLVFIAVIYMYCVGTCVDSAGSFETTRYGKVCITACTSHSDGNYSWCWTGRWWWMWDYCSLSAGLTRYGDVCRGQCGKHTKSYYWCYLDNSDTDTTKWEYCSVPIRRTSYVYTTAFYEYYCQTTCTKGDGDYNWCNIKGGWVHSWDYCSPKSTASQVWTTRDKLCSGECKRYDGWFYDYSYCYTDTAEKDWDYCGQYNPTPTVVTETSNKYVCGSPCQSSTCKLLIGQWWGADRWEACRSENRLYTIDCEGGRKKRQPQANEVCPAVSLDTHRDVIWELTDNNRFVRTDEQSVAIQRDTFQAISEVTMDMITGEARSGVINHGTIRMDRQGQTQDGEMNIQFQRNDIPRNERNGRSTTTAGILIRNVNEISIRFIRRALYLSKRYNRIVRIRLEDDRNG